MTSWQSEYLLALKSRDEQHSIHKRYIEAYSTLADRIANKNSPASSDPDPNNSEPIAQSKNVSRIPVEDSKALSDLRSSLATSQRDKLTLTTTVTTLTQERDKVRSLHTSDLRRIQALTTERNSLTQRICDKNEELRGKARLAQEAQDEMLTLQLQLNMAEEKSGKLEGENRDLVDRWMRKMGEEAEAMNLASRYT
ncbi:MAG: hypothetical protein M1814_004500 [Vezdaea aestivalis]|nr:MAG: hypothetical protein M1814_004500 [Vezdaea aestivalis]